METMEGSRRVYNNDDDKNNNSNNNKGKGCVTHTHTHTVALPFALKKSYLKVRQKKNYGRTQIFHHAKKKY
jgi:hypothetical protein